MTRTPPLAILALFSGAILVGCDPAELGPTSPSMTPRFNFVNGPPELVNVIRFSTNDGGFALTDTESGLIAVEGLPADPSTFFGCEGGQNPASTLTYQQVGWLRGVIKNHIVGRDVTIHVFQLSDLDVSQSDPYLHLWCTGTPIAAGTGNVMLADNDMFSSGEHNAVTAQMQGLMTDLRTGESLRLTAHFHIVLNSAGSASGDPVVKVENTYVRLNSVGGQ